MAKLQNRKDIELLEEEIKGLKNKENLTEEEMKRLNELEQQLHEKLEFEHQLIGLQGQQDQMMKEMM